MKNLRSLKWMPYLLNLHCSAAPNVEPKTQPSLVARQESFTELPIDEHLIWCWSRPDVGLPDDWKDSCFEQILFTIRRDLPDQYTFGNGGLPVPHYYYGPPNNMSESCTARFELLNGASSDTIDSRAIQKWLGLIYENCVNPPPRPGLGNSAGTAKPVGVGNNLKITFGAVNYLPPEGNA